MIYTQLYSSNNTYWNKVRILQDQFSMDINACIKFLSSTYEF